MSEQETFEQLTLRRVVSPDGDVRWYNSDNCLHRVSGPAIEYINGEHIWFFNGVIHRIDGPAIRYNDGHQEWWLEGVHVTKDEFDERTRNI